MLHTHSVPATVLGELFLAEGVLRNVGEMISREPLTPTELLVHSLLLSNEFIYVN